MGRRLRVGPRQPDMEGHDAGLRGEPDQEEQEDPVPERRVQGPSDVPHRGEVEPAGRAAEESERGDQRCGRQMRQGDVDVAGPDGNRARPGPDDEGRGRDRHRFPCEQEREPAVRAEEEPKGSEEGRVGDPVEPRSDCARVPCGVDGGREADDAEGGDEGRPEAVVSQLDCEAEDASGPRDERPAEGRDRRDHEPGPRRDRGEGLGEGRESGADERDQGRQRERAGRDQERRRTG